MNPTDHDRVGLIQQQLIIRQPTAANTCSDTRTTGINTTSLQFPLKKALHPYDLSLPSHVPLPLACTAAFIPFFCYVVYMRYFHSLSRYPGPLLASLTNTYKANYVYNLTLHEKLLELHIRYGAVVRIGSKHLYTWKREAIALIYKDG